MHGYGCATAICMDDGVQPSWSRRRRRRSNWTSHCKRTSNGIGSWTKWESQFYAPWCRLCIQFEDSYRTIGASLSASNVKVGKLNSAVNEAFSARFATQSVPTLFVIKGDTAYRYTGALSRDSVAQYAKDGHKSNDSLPLLSSPMGPFGKIKGLMITTGLKLRSMHLWLLPKRLVEMWLLKWLE